MEPTSSHLATTPPAASGRESSASQEYLIFQLGKEEYGVNILKVQEIREYESVTAIANAPKYVKGIINLRGAIVPIVDMRIKFGIEKPLYNQFTVVIILNLHSKLIGAVVDSVSDVTSLAADEIRDAPEMSASMNARYLSGIGTANNRMLLLVEIDELMRIDDVNPVEKWAA